MEHTLEQLVAIEKYIIAKPAASCRKKTTAEVLAGQFHRLHVVACNIGLLLGLLELPVCRPHLVSTVVGEPEGSNCGNGKRYPESILRSALGIRRLAAATVENDQEDDEQDLVDKLTPTLHQESHGDLATTMKPIVPGRELSSCHCVFH